MKKQNNIDTIVLLTQELIKLTKQVQALEKEREDLYKNFKAIKRTLKLISKGMKHGEQRLNRIENELEDDSDFFIHSVQ